MNMKRFIGLTAAAAVSGMAFGALADEYIMMPDSSNNQLVLFDPEDGSVVDPSFIDMSPYESATPIHAIVVDDEIWVSNQGSGGRINRFDIEDQTFLGAIEAGINNIRGMIYHERFVYVANFGTSDGAPGRAVVRIDPERHIVLDHFPTEDNGSPWSFLIDDGDLLVGASTTNRIDRHDPETGAFLGTFYSGTASFVHQISRKSDGNIYVSGFSPPRGVFEIDANGNEIEQLFTFSGSGNRGVWELGNGNILWSDNDGAHVYDIDRNQHTLVHAGTGRHFGLLSTAAPCIADWNGDGEVDINDFFAYLSDFEAGDPRADLNNDGEIDINDFFIFLTEFEAGC